MLETLKEDLAKVKQDAREKYLEIVFSLAQDGPEPDTNTIREVLETLGLDVSDVERDIEVLKTRRQYLAELNAFSDDRAAINADKARLEELQAADTALRVEADRRIAEIAKESAELKIQIHSAERDLSDRVSRRAGYLSTTHRPPTRRMRERAARAERASNRSARLLSEASAVQARIWKFDGDLDAKLSAARMELDYFLSDRLAVAGAPELPYVRERREVIARLEGQVRQRDAMQREFDSLQAQQQEAFREWCELSRVERDASWKAAALSVENEGEFEG